MNLFRKATWLFCVTFAAATLAAAVGTAGGVRWTVPSRWTEQPSRSMRAATYTISGAKGAEAAECGVFYFGKGRGGGVEENITRWSQQFEGTPKPRTSKTAVRGIAVHRVDISGAYLSPSGPMMQSQGTKPGYRLLGAIVEAPGGLVFFKCVGPAATVSAAEKELDGLIGSIEKTASAV